MSPNNPNSLACKQLHGITGCYPADPEKQTCSLYLIFSMCMIFTLGTLWRFRLSICTLLVGKCCLQAPGTANVQEAGWAEALTDTQEIQGKSWERKWRDRKCMKILPCESYICVTGSLCCTDLAGPLVEPIALWQEERHNVNSSESKSWFSGAWICSVPERVGMDIQAEFLVYMPIA